MIIKPPSLTESSLIDYVTFLNLYSVLYDVHNFLLSKYFYKRLIQFNLIDNCYFNFQVSRYNIFPLYPEPICKTKIL